MGELYCNPCEKKEKKEETCNVTVIVNCGEEKKQPWPCGEDRKEEKKCDGCNVTIIVNCGKEKKEYKDSCQL